MLTVNGLVVEPDDVQAAGEARHLGAVDHDKVDGARHVHQVVGIVHRGRVAVEALFGGLVAWECSGGNVF